MGTKYVLYMPRYYCTIMERHLNGKDTIYKENALVQYDDENNEYFSEIGKNLGLERYTSSDHNITISKLFAMCDFLDISLSDFFLIFYSLKKSP